MLSYSFLIQLKLQYHAVPIQGFQHHSTCFMWVCTRLNEWELLSVWLIYSHYPFHLSLVCLYPTQSFTAWCKLIFFLLTVGMPSPSFSISSYHLFEGLFQPPIYLPLPRLKQLPTTLFFSYILSHWSRTTYISHQPSKKKSVGFLERS